MSQPAKIRGRVERLTFVNPDNGYTIARVSAEGAAGPVTVVGALPRANVGETFDFSGEWTAHPRYGRQFKVSACEPVRPATLEGIEKYLGSGMIKGIGPAMARLLVKKFGDKTLDVIEKTPEKLRQVGGIGKKRVGMIAAAWNAQKDVRDVMIFLRGHGVGAGYAVKIYRQYGRDAVRIVREDPFRLAADIHGIGFFIADRIAGTLGVDRDSPSRAEAGIRHALAQWGDEGHVFCPYETLVERACRLLGVDRETVVEGFSSLFLKREIVIEDMNGPGEYVPNRKAVYAAAAHAAEKAISLRLKTLLEAKSPLSPPAEAEALARVQAQMNIELAGRQRECLARALRHKVMIITGGPGTGKTTLIRAVLNLFEPLTRKILLAAPTGRAARRMAEATGRDARTIHRMLEWDFAAMTFKRGGGNPLDAELVVLDEVSMIDNLLMAQCLKAVPDRAVLFLVGDVDQLPSVGAGNVLRDLLASGRVPAVRLDKIFRQAMGSLIVTNAHRINAGRFPEAPGDGAAGDADFRFIEKEDPGEMEGLIVDLAARRLPERFGFDPMRDIQVLSPMHKGVIGTRNLNAVLQAALNPGAGAVQAGDRPFKPGDRIMQIVNNYDRDVFNGDIGRVLSIDAGARTLAAEFDGRAVEYDFADADELTLAYAVSIHKSQGSEYPAVIVPLHTSHYILLARNLLYTAVTRAKKLLVLIGSKRAVSMALRNDKPLKRYTRLAERLRESG